MRLFQKKESWELAQISNPDGAHLGSRLLLQNCKAKRSDFPFLIYCTLKLANDRINDQEWELAEQIDSALEEWEPVLGFVTVAIVTLAGKRDWILYARDGQEAMNALHLRLSEKGIQLECNEDPKWSQYYELLGM